MDNYDLNELMDRQNSAMLEAETFIDDEIADILANPEVRDVFFTSLDEFNEGKFQEIVI